jgi:predicted ferric reductase
MTLLANNRSFYVVVLGICLFLGLWLLDAVWAWVSDCCFFRGPGIIVGVATYVLFSFSLLLSSRWRKLEDWLGGLDRIYHLHRQVGVWAFCLMLAHPWIISLKWLPNRFNRFIVFTFPIHDRLSVNLGSLAFWLAILILGVTLLKVLPYDKWKILHKFMSVVFLLASLHILQSEKRFGGAWAQSLLYLPMGIGFFGIFYKQVYMAFFSKKELFKVDAVRSVSENVREVVLLPVKAFPAYIPGQYGFFTFVGPMLTRESHPFTMVGSRDEGPSLSLFVKARGDYTIGLSQHLQKGYSAQFEGPYGRFDYVGAGNTQIWIAGGIGVVPFIAWIRAMKGGLPPDLAIDFYYCVHKKSDAVLDEELKEFESRYPRFRYFLHCSEANNRLDVDKILTESKSFEGKTILMCGPKKLTKGFTEKFLALGVKRSAIMYEDFEFI